MTTTGFTTTPSEIRIAPTDQFSQAVDCGPSLPPGGTVSSPTATLTDLTDNTPVTIPTAVATGTLVNVVLTGSDLVAGHRYLLRVVFDGGPRAHALTVTTIVACVPLT